jgi:hypothetical protein
MATKRGIRLCAGTVAQILCFLGVLIAFVALDGAASLVVAQSAKTLKGQCIKLYKSWQRKDGYGAFAGSKNGHCGLSYGYPTIEEARRRALVECRKSHSKGCTVFAEKSRPSRVAKPDRPNLKGKSEAISLKAFQAKHGLSTDEMRRRFGAAGKVVCPFSSGTVFLVGRPDVFVTSDHIFIDIGRKGKPRSSISKCWVQFFFSKQRYSIKPSSIIHGLKSNKTAYQFVWYDWAVGQIDRPARDVVPLVASTVVPGSNFTVSVLSQGMNDSIPRVCTGVVTSAWGNYSVNDITTDCSTGPGASGGPIVVGSLESDPNFPLKVIALTWGTKSLDAETNNHVGMPISDGELQKALQKLLGNQGQDVKRSSSPYASPTFRLALLKLIDSGNSCKVVYGLDNQSNSDLSQMTLSIDYTDDFRQLNGSQITKLEQVHAGETVQFEQTPQMLCRRISEVALNSIRSVAPVVDYSSIESLTQNVTLESHTVNVRMMKFNGPERAGVQ